MDHICHYHEFEEMEPKKKVNEKNLDYIKKSNPTMHMFNCLKIAVPLINLDAPQGTAIFQTYFEYNYGKLFLALFLKNLSLVTKPLHEKQIFE